MKETLYETALESVPAESLEALRTAIEATRRLDELGADPAYLLVGRVPELEFLPALLAEGYDLRPTMGTFRPEVAASVRKDLNILLEVAAARGAPPDLVDARRSAIEHALGPSLSSPTLPGE